jgi:uncharacterized membrane protein YccF (DUF307 family)
MPRRERQAEAPGAHRPRTIASPEPRTHGDDAREPAVARYDQMRVLLNIVWLVLAGFWMAIGYAIAALIMFVLIITIPFGIAAVRVGLFALWPFGRTVIRREDAGAGSAIGNVLWFLLAGWWLIIGHVVTGVLLCLTIIGIPLGLANFKMIPVTLRPFGRDIVSIEQAEQQGLSPQVMMPATPSRAELPGSNH